MGRAPGMDNPSPWTGRRVAVTGGTGFLGSHLVRRLVLEAAEVHVASRSAVSNRARQSDPLITPHALDLTDEAETARVLSTIRPAVVFHLAAYGTLPAQSDAALISRVNVSGTLHLLEACRRAGRPLVVYVSSCSERTLAAFSDPCDQRMAYSATKLAAAGICRAYDSEGIVPCIVTRLFTAYGPGEPAHRLVPSVVRALLRGETPQISSGEQRRDFAYVDDLVDGLLRVAAAPGACGQRIELGTGRATSVREVVQTLVRISGRPIQAQYGVMPKRSDDVEALHADPEPAERIAGWRASTSLEDGLRKTWAWHAEQSVEQAVGIG